MKLTKVLENLYATERNPDTCTSKFYLEGVPLKFTNHDQCLASS